MHNADFDGADDQDGAEVFDETNLTEDGRDIANFESLDDVFDVTQAEGDADDAVALALDEADFDPEAFDEDEAAEDELGEPPGDYEADIGAAGTVEQARGDEDAIGADEVEGLDLAGDADTVEDGEDGTRTFESRRLGDRDLETLGYAARPAPAGPESAAERRLDEGLRETFPASDPMGINPGAD